MITIGSLGTYWSPRTNRLRGIDADTQSVNSGIHSAWRKDVTACSGDVSSTVEKQVAGVLVSLLPLVNEVENMERGHV